MQDNGLIAAVVAEMALVPSETPTAIISPSADHPFDFASLISKAEAVSTHWVIEIPKLGEVLETFAKHDSLSFFMVSPLPGRLFATNVAIVPGNAAVVIAGGQIGSTAATESSDTSADPQISKVYKTAEERYVLGVVLVPESTDSQGDIYSHDEVRSAAHYFMENAGALGKQHREIVTGKLKILESYLAPADFEIEGETVSKGTWLMGIRVLDDDLWSGIKKGDFTGFSIGGQAFRRPEVS